MPKLSRKLLPLLVVGSAFGIAIVLISSRPAPRRKPASFSAPLVETLAVTATTARIMLTSQGTVVPSQEITLLPEVSGKLIWVSEKFIPGSKLRKGEVIAKIDPRNYQAVVEAQKAQLEQALLNLELEKGKKRVAEREWSLLQKNLKAKDDLGRALALREPQLRSAKSSVAAANQALEKANLDLARTNLRAPFNAVIISKDADLGQVVGAGRPLAKLAGTDSFWVEANVPLGHVSFLQDKNSKGAKSDAVIVQRSEGQISEKAGKVIRVMSNLDPVGRMAKLIIAVKDPLSNSSGGLPLFLGAFTDIQVAGETRSNVFKIPESVVQDDGKVLILKEDNSLDIRKINVVWKTRDSVIVDKGLKSGDRIIMTRVPTPIQGMKLRIKGETQARPAIPGKRS